MRAIRDITVGELMSKPVVTVTPDTTIEALTALMSAHDFNAFPVVNDAGALLGLVRGSTSSAFTCCRTPGLSPRSRRRGCPRSARS
jgi:CBS-domain-containing membrane protein